MNITLFRDLAIIILCIINIILLVVLVYVVIIAYGKVNRIMNTADRIQRRLERRLESSGLNQILGILAFLGGTGLYGYLWHRRHKRAERHDAPL